MAPRRSPLAALRTRVFVALGLVVALTVGGYVAINVIVQAELSSVTRVQVNLSPAPSDGANYLLIGSDTRSFVTNTADQEAFGDSSEAGGNRSDTIMVLHVYSGGTRSLLVSFPRDLWVDIPGKGNAKINAAFNDGPQAVVDTIQNDFNIPINHYVEVNFDTFRSMVNAIGTVPVYFPAAARDDLTGLNVATPGCVQLDGPSALAFVRSRHLELLDPATGKWRDADPIPDIGRVARQQAFLRVLGQVAMDEALSNPFNAPNIIDSAVAQLKLDDGFGRGDLFSLVGSFHADSDGPSGLETLTLPTSADTRGGQSVLLPKQPGADELLARLRDFSEPAEAPSAASPEDVSVRVLNGSGEDGAAATALKALEGQGFNGEGSGNASRAISTSEVHYHSGDEGKATVVAGFVSGPVKLLVDPNVSGADVELVIGRSFSGITKPAVAAPAAPTAGAAPTQASLAPVPGKC
jgi:LCP family protein required for cell wall assembly